MNLKEIQKEVLETLDERQIRWLRKSVDLETFDMRKMSTEDVRKIFVGKPKYEEDETFSTVDDSRMIRTFIWQSYLLLKLGKIKPLEGNLRSFWYKDLGPFVKFHNLLVTDEAPIIAARGFTDVFPDVVELMGDFIQMRDFDGFEEILFRGGGGREMYLTNKMGISFDQFVIRGFFRFQDEFKFQDSREFFRVIGKKRPRFILYTEKEGLFWLCKDIAQELGITVIASQGEPGWLTMEYFSDALKARGVKNVEVATLTDYDPWGYNISENFGEKLMEPVFGFGVNTEHLTSLDLFTKESIKYKKRDLTQVSYSKKKQVDDWMKITGGINGEPFGMHIDNADFGRIKKAVKKWYKRVSK